MILENSQRYGIACRRRLLHIWSATFDKVQGGVTHSNPIVRELLGKAVRDKYAEALGEEVAICDNRLAKVNMAATEALQHYKASEFWA